MKHSPANLDKYATDNAPRFRHLARQMLDMHTPEFDKHFTSEIATAHTEAASAMMRLALLMEKRPKPASRGYVAIPAVSGERYPDTLGL